MTHRYVKLDTSAPSGGDVAGSVHMGISFMSIDSAKNNLLVQQAGMRGAPARGEPHMPCVAWVAVGMARAR